MALDLVGVEVAGDGATVDFPGLGQVRAGGAARVSVAYAGWLPQRELHATSLIAGAGGGEAPDWSVLPLWRGVLGDAGMSAAPDCLAAGGGEDPSGLPTLVLSKSPSTWVTTRRPQRCMVYRKYPG